jgi:transcriptional regulator with XRE-family HTH domain
MVGYKFKGSSLKKFLKKKKITIVDAACRLGVSRQTVYQYFDSDTLNRESVKKILEVFEAKESDIFEAEFMEMPKVQNEINQTVQEYANQFIELEGGKSLVVTPLIEDYSQSEFIKNHQNPEFINQLPNHSIVIEVFKKGKYFSFRVLGEAMDNGTSESIKENSIVTAREIPKDFWQSHFLTVRNKDYVIICQNGVFIKRVSGYSHDRQEITCSSLNPENFIYPDFELKLSECIMILTIISVTTNR